MPLSRRDQTILGTGVSTCGALLLLSTTVATPVGLAVGLAGIAVLGDRPGPGSGDADGDPG